MASVIGKSESKKIENRLKVKERTEMSHNER